MSHFYRTQISFDDAQLKALLDMVARGHADAQFDHELTPVHETVLTAVLEAQPA